MDQGWVGPGRNFGTMPTSNSHCSCIHPHNILQEEGGRGHLFSSPEATTNCAGFHTERGGGGGGGAQGFPHPSESSPPPPEF